MKEIKKIKTVRIDGKQITRGRYKVIERALKMLDINNITCTSEIPKDFTLYWENGTTFLGNDLILTKIEKN